MSPTRIGEDHRETLALALVVWLCSMPLVLLLAVPFLGWRTGATIGVTWLLALLIICFGICLHRFAPLRRR